MVPTNTGIFLGGLKLCGGSRTQKVLLLSKRKLGVTVHFSEIIKLLFEKKKKSHTLLCILLLLRIIVA